MRKLLLVCAAALMVGGAVAQEQTVNYVDVQGNSERYVMPDEIFVQITINESDTKGKQALAVQERDMIKELKALGIDVEKNLTVMDMSSDYRYFMLKKNDVLVSKDYKLQLSSAKQLAQVVQGLEKIGIANINVISTNYSKMEELKAELRGEAIKYAKTKAAQLATAIGQNIGPAILINDYDGFAPMMDEARPMLMAKSANGASADVPNLNYQQTKVTYRVSARFQLLK